MTLPRLRLRDEVAGLLDLPWEVPLEKWDDTGHRFRELPVGPSRHLVRFLVHGGLVYALKELPEAVAQREFDVLRHLEETRLPGVRAVGLAVRPDRSDAIQTGRIAGKVMRQTICDCERPNTRPTSTSLRSTPWMALNTPR